MVILIMKILKKYDTNKKSKITTKWPEHVITLEGKNFKIFIEKFPLSIIDFWASWCIPCKTMAPRMRRLANLYKGKVAFGKLNIQKNQNISKEYQIKGIPHLIFFKYGKKVNSINGVKSIGYIKKVIENHLEV
jgi:thioredoxin 1